MIKFVTAGESHGKGLITVVSGFPSNLEVSEKYINSELRRRQLGYGRGLRMKIETDTAEIFSGVRFGKTMASPISMLIRNRDWENWTEKMSVEPIDKEIEKITIPRPGHADLVGSQKYNYNDIRNSIDRSSARETAARVAACSVAKRFLEELGIHVGSYVESIGGVYPKDNFVDKLFSCELPEKFSAKKINEAVDESSVRVFDEAHEKKIVNKIKVAKKRGDTLGGTFFVVVSGVPVGLGSFIQYDTRIEASLAHAIMSIQAVKGVEIGIGFEGAELFGSQVHDEIILKKDKFWRTTNHAGGIEGGITTGLPIIVRGAMKPISTLMTPLKSIDLATMKKVEARRERSDFVAVPACAVIAEGMVAWVVAEFVLQKFGGDSMEETKANYESYVKQNFENVKKNFKRK
ncbi:MAG: chorismate synthase [Stygiobacter sp. RIFOXYC12_FULL_38_8]|nr:MAG: chorismate synthase [Stygiobacter sp. GWC2_38_9]OGU84051.1 MAG: chorismate synthase [Stygiobacter sp. RIFOXYA12_FULL_38_9]OGV06416.1 MAG: chorismate synthase [Stygiobacter sp. RIFOXYB2_FULL_37_11]OGV10236.1 MAG: chorismate synthase [Stygiobacter sp. RIFOXYA2_FULL_38_8]OGV14010.1 MAG: chorismate synthase [Stygiobacter sp. RIFOXYC2_FULL_38_25]OGV26109.1 MAG: chorismate synthase [Stygiobacter sp. RIFOXYC12_FULL_38_8]OGV82341.1 MAG: chorismate synthase [Stygiobacter sp. GWF2_38_21]